MRKVYVMMVGLSVVVFTGCTLKAPTMPEISTGGAVTGVEMTGVESTGVIIPSSEMEEFTGAFDSGVVPTVTGSEGIDVRTGVTAEVKDLIDERKTQSGDDTKLTEEDIGLMEQIIQKIQNIGK